MHGAYGTDFVEIGVKSLGTGERVLRCCVSHLMSWLTKKKPMVRKVAPKGTITPAQPTRMRSLSVIVLQVTTVLCEKLKEVGLQILQTEKTNRHTNSNES